MIKKNISSSKPFKAFQLFATDHQFHIRTSSKQYTSQQYSSIKINRLTSKLTSLTQQQFNAQVSVINPKYRQQIDLLMGIIIINTQPYLLVVTDIQTCGILQTDRIYQIRKSKFIPFKHKFLYGSIDQAENEKIIDYIEGELIKENFYFCYHSDITLTRTKHFDQILTERRFWWNQAMVDQLGEVESALKKKELPYNCWLPRVIQGHVREIYCENQYFSFYYLIISRRAKQMSGTRFNHRGLDQDYNAANFVETQEIIICHNFLFSHVSLRGSVPLFWKQQSVKTQIILKHKLEAEHQVAITRHYEKLVQCYKGAICTINLLSKNKSPEKDLKSRFEYYFYRALKQNPKFNTYLFFDLNQEMKDQNGQKSIDMFMKNAILQFSCQQNFFVIDRFTKQVLCVQKIYPRINCLDCIDRTNVIMARVSEHYLHQVQEFINQRVTIKGKKLRIDQKFKKNLVELWVELGNRISMLYCGTESVANHMTKRQNNSLLTFLSGGIKSINRYYNATLNDDYKHDCIQNFLMLKGMSSCTPYFQDNISSGIIDEMKYCSFEQLKIYVLTWNCSMVDPQTLSTQQRHKIFTFLSEDIQLVVFNLQQIVQLNGYNVLLRNNQTVLESWTRIMLQGLNDEQINPRNQSNTIQSSTTNKYQQKPLKSQHNSFRLLTSHDLVGVAAFVFCRKRLLSRIENYEWLDVKTGLKGNSGHKGAVMLFLQIDSTWITFINCHLASGQAKKNQRLQDIDFIHNQAIKERHKRRLFDMSEFRFFSGDMNFCVELNSQIIRETLTKIQKLNQEKQLSKKQLAQLINPLLLKDEKFITKTGHLNAYNQPEIYFMPTYRFETKTKSYDIKKTPYWYDRVLYNSKDSKKISILRYNDVDVYLSDHKPVFAMFNVIIRKQNLQRKNSFITAYMHV